MKEIRVYVVDCNDYEGCGCLTTMHHEEFMAIAEELGTVYSLKGFETTINNSWLSLDNAFIRFVEVECEESINFEDFEIPKSSI